MINKTDLFIYCDWLEEQSIDVSIARLVINLITPGIIDVSQLGCDISDDDHIGFGDGNSYGNGYGDGMCYNYRNRSNNGYGSNGDDDGDGDGFDGSQMCDYWDPNNHQYVADGCGSGTDDDYGVGFDSTSNP